jgi:hypothetical protein
MTASTAPVAHRRETIHRQPVQIVAAVFGIVFLIVGVAGFVPGITQHLDHIEWAGHHSRAELLGVFRVSVLHNIVHLLFGVVGLAAYRSVKASRSFLLIGGVIYAALFVYGLAIDKGTDADFVPLNDADDWLHLGLAAAMILASLLPNRTERDDRSDALHLR